MTDQPAPAATPQSPSAGEPSALPQAAATPDPQPISPDQDGVVDTKVEGATVHESPTVRRRRTRNANKIEQIRADIVRASRSIMDQGKELTLRSVAAEMGLSAPALYRYVDSMSQLMNMVATETIEEVITQVRAKMDEGPQHPLLRLITAFVYTRAWALQHPEQYRLTYVTVPRPELSDAGELDQRRLEVESQLQWLYATDFMKVVADYDLRDTNDARFNTQVPDSVAELFKSLTTHSVIKPTPDLEPWMLWKFERFYAMFYGVVQLEATGRVPDDVVQSGSLVLYSIYEVLDPTKFGELASEALHYGQDLLRTAPTGRPPIAP